MKSFFDKFEVKFIETFLSIFELLYKKFYTFHARPVQTDKIETEHFSLKNYSSKSVCIIMQGPIIKDNDFTINTLSLYKKIFRKHSIILSTWDDESSLNIDRIKSLGIEVILNKKPDYAGIANINFHIVSTSSGVTRAFDEEHNYVLKTRTDQRIHSPLAIDMCFSALDTFPLSKKNLLQKERVIAFNLNTFMYRPFSISDMIIFGNIHDMKKYWCVDQDQRKIHELKEPTNLIEWSSQKLAEVYFVDNFLNNIDQPYQLSLEGSWRVLAENFCILNTYDIDLFWNKYSKKEFRHDKYIFHRNKQINFAEWLVMHNNFPKEIPEYIINKRD